jgi:beta-ribofuranosylaminobenzene 5'-phosphate synthase
MIDDPGLSIRVEPSERWLSTGPHAERALEVARAVSARLAEMACPVGPVQITVERAPRAHVGLGVGTQLSLALARSLCSLVGMPEAPVELLSALTGRGRRSGIGLHGFDRGGFLIDGGRTQSSETPALLVQRPFPADWRVLVVIPGTQLGLHGLEESQAFQALSSWPEASSQRLCHLVLLGVLPALVENDLPAFGSALREIQLEVGRGFASVQGGPYSHPLMESLLQRLEQAGVVGLGQSSWGPTVYGFAHADDASRLDVSRVLKDACTTFPVEAFWTQASPTGAVIVG